MNADTPFGAPPMSGGKQGWKAYRPVIWSLMAAVAVALLVNPWFVAMFPVGVAIGLSARIWRGRHPRRRRA
jgi:hypothetical protein